MTTADRDAFEKLLGVCRKLRGPDGCPWDRAQTLETMGREGDLAAADTAYTVLQEEIAGFVQVLQNLESEVHPCRPIPAPEPSKGTNNSLAGA